MTMRSDFLGRLRNTELRLGDYLMPVFEAVSNSIDAVGDSATRAGPIEVTIHRQGELFEDQHGNVVPGVQSISIADSGCGFTAANYESFETLDSSLKEGTGGKGVGRLLWLLAFDHASIRSTYQENGTQLRRTFTFRRHQSDPIEGGEPLVVDVAEPNCTIVTLRSPLDGFAEKLRKRAETLARRVLEHFLTVFVLRPEIDIVVMDDSRTGWSMSLREEFEAVYQPEIDVRRFKVNEHEFEIRDVFLATESESATHEIHFCALGRSVKTIQLGQRVSHLDASIVRDGGTFVYTGCVTGRLLDDSVNAGRTEFTLSRRGELELGGSTSLEDIEEQAIAIARDALAEPIAESKARSWERTQEYVNHSEPEYRHLLHAKREVLESIPETANHQRLRQELNRVHWEYREEVSRRANTALEELESTQAEYEEYAEKIRPLFEEIQQEAHAALARFVHERSIVLRFLASLLGKNENGQFAKEDALHTLFFPRRNTSDEIEFDDHHLWLLDERLAYHTFLSSDLPLNHPKNPIGVDSKKKPDVLVLQRRLAYTEGDNPLSAVTIVEFKRPERDDYGKKGESDPFQQVFEYVELLREGRGHKPSGETIELSPNATFHAIVVATITPSLRKRMKRDNRTERPDGGGFFYFHKELNAYIELLSFAKVLEDARRRNRAFFRKLGIPDV